MSASTGSVTINSASQEDISFSYFLAICAEKNIIVNRELNDANSDDVTIRKICLNSKGVSVESAIFIQLKSCYSHDSYSVLEDGKISYRLKNKNYTDLIAESIIPKYLLILILPENSSQWVEESDDSLLLRRKMIWTRLTGQDPSDQDLVTIRIPNNQIVTSEWVDSILRKAVV